MIFTQEVKDELLVKFLIAYDAWCDTDINPEGFSIASGLCSNIDTFQDNRNIREFGIAEDAVDDEDDCHAHWVSTNWLLWDHLNNYFDKDEDGEPETEPFGKCRDETGDFRENPKRRAWVKKMISQLLDYE